MELSEQLLATWYMVMSQVEKSEASKPAKAPDISPLIALEQSSADVSAADLAGAPAGSAGDAPGASGAPSDPASIPQGLLA